MKICIIRHGSAVLGGDEDASRALTPKGLLQAQGAGSWVNSLIAQGQLSDNAEIIASPYLRAQQTAAEVAAACKMPITTDSTITPAGAATAVVDKLTGATQDIILVSHLPLVGRLAARLVDGEEFDQPWSPAECWLLEGEIAASGCMTVTSVWYPALEGI